MNAETLQKIKEDLLKQKAQLTEELAGIGQDVNSRRGPDMPDYGTENDENAQEVEQYTTNLEADKILEKTLADVTTALKNIENNTYGICKYCGKEIEEKDF